MSRVGETVAGAARARRRRPERWYRSTPVEILQFAVLAAALIGITVRGAESMGYNWQWAKVPRYIYRVVEVKSFSGR